MSVVTTARAYGCHDVVALDSNPTPRHIDYLDLMKTFPNQELKVDAVAEFQSRPLLYIVSGAQATNVDRDEILELQQLLANRGERAYLGILTPGELNVYPINLDRSALRNGTPFTIKKDAPDASQFFQSIVHGGLDLDGQPESSDYVYKTIHDLMTQSSQRLIGTYHLNPLDVLSFLGRALFLRFLLDRKIILQRELSDICPHAKTPGDCFQNVVNSVATCRWLDETFNGDLLPLSGSYEDVFKLADVKTEAELFLHLRAIIEGWEHAGLGMFQPHLPIDWLDLNFSHIPIGVLSQVYENFSQAWDKQQAEATSVYYTPKNIARYLVDDAFAGVANKSAAKLLDPSCGAGIFLILAFRKLVAARWESDGKRPNTSTIQSILYNQVCGFDVSESALRLAALSLYITAIELNDSPRPPKSLKFPRPLKGRVLFNHRNDNEQDAKDFVLGSLRPDLSPDFNGRFDLVLGNPPWSSLKGNAATNKAHNDVFTRLSRQAMTARGLADMAANYQNPDNNPDLPFLWAATRWAKPNAIIAMALPSRIFLKQSSPGTRAFNAILRGVTITGILNGSNLSDTDVWPGMNQPFMLFFARNAAPNQNHHFHFVTPHLEYNLNKKGRIRIDYHSAQPISCDQISEYSHLLKTLSIGTTLDLEVMNKLNNLHLPTVQSYWNQCNLYSGVGYILSTGNKVQYDATRMIGLPDFAPPSENTFFVHIDDLHKFSCKSAHMPRSFELYKPPLLIVPESPGLDNTRPKSWVLRSPTTFKSSYYGFSGNGNSEGELLVTFLHLITHSELFEYHVLLTSSKIGAERRTFQKRDLESFPFHAPCGFTQAQKKTIRVLSSQLESSQDKPLEAINDFIFELYDLDKYDRQTITDTLRVSSPFIKERQCANATPSQAERAAFYAELQRLLAPSFDVTGEEVVVSEINRTAHKSPSPWHVFSVTTTSVSRQMESDNGKLVSKIIQVANESGCSRAVVHGNGYLLVGVLGQYRYWTLSRARLCALDILRNHLASFPIGSS